LASEINSKQLNWYVLIYVFIAPKYYFYL